MSSVPALIRNGRPYAVGLAFGLVGGGLFAWLQLPLPWMLGAMTAALIGALVGLPMKAPHMIAAPMRVVLGVLLGASFSPELLARAGSLVTSLAFVLPYVVVAAALGIPYLRRVAGFDLKTAYFAAMPAGVNDMVLFAQEAGADMRRVALVHAARILLIVFAVPFWIEWSGGLDIDRAARGWVALTDVPWRDALILTVCGLIGWPLAVRLKLPAATILGPMLVSGAVHLLGWSAAKPPDLLVAAAQLVLGMTIGSRFADIRPAEIAHILAISAGLAAILMAVTLGTAALLPPVVGQSGTAVLLAFAPGGVAETSLIALSLGIETAYVACHHLLRILLAIVGAPLVFRLIRRWT